MNIAEANRWLEYARKDLHAATALIKNEEFFPLQVCFLSQQSAEKAIKTILVGEAIDFPKIHDLDRLRDLLPLHWKLKNLFPNLADLTIWAIESRYPSNAPDVTEGEARQILQMAKAVFDAVESEMAEKIRLA